MLSTIQGSYFQEVFPKMWDLGRIKDCVSNQPEDVLKRQPFWNPNFNPVMCDNLEAFGAMMGHEIAMQIRQTKEEGRELAAIFPVGPLGMYKWTIYFLQQWGIDCKHVHGFIMDEWSDKEGNTLPDSNPGAFKNIMTRSFYGPLGELTVPESQRHFATKDELLRFGDQMNDLQAKGAKRIMVYGIGRMCHIAFWEPQFAEEYATDEEWLKEDCRIAANLHPLTIEQNAITSFKSSWPLIPCYANTIGPGVMFKADYTIGGADGILSRGMMWQGMSFWMTLRYGATRAVTSSYIPTIPGKLFFMKELAGPLCSDAN